MSFLINLKGTQITIETYQGYTPWLELVNLLVSGKATEDIKVESTLSLAHLRIRSLPNKLSVKGDLDLRQCQRLSRIGKGLKVEGNLLIGGGLNKPAHHQRKLSGDFGAPLFLRKLSKDGQIPLRYLPESLEVGGDLIIRSAPLLRSLPSKFSIGKNLLLHGCEKLEKLPESLNVNGDLILISCPNLQSLPSKLKARKLVLIGCGVESIPHTINIQESIHIESCPKLTSLAAGLQCLETGDLEEFIIHNCPIEAMPYYVNASKLIKFSRLSTKLINDSLLEAEAIRITNCKNLERVDSLLNPKRSLSFRNCRKLEYFSAPTNYIRQLDLTNCESLVALPNGIEFLGQDDRLLLTNCFQLTQLPEPMEFTGKLEVSGCALKTIPKKMQKCRVSWRGHWITPDVIFAPESLTPERILTDPNAEIRRLMLERVGIQTVLSKASASTIDLDKDAGGERSLIQVQIRTNWSEQTLRFLRCCCPSTGREYLLPVPPTIRSCRVAAAWLAGFDNPDDYQPLLET